MNKTEYSLASTQYGDSPGGLAYLNVTGHAPQIFKAYQQNVAYSEAKEIHQADNIVYIGTNKLLSSS